MLFETRKSGRRKLPLPWSVSTPDSLPPFFYDPDALVRRMAVAWYIGSLPRKDLLIKNGLSRDAVG